MCTISAENSGFVSSQKLGLTAQPFAWVVEAGFPRSLVDDVLAQARSCAVRVTTRSYPELPIGVPVLGGPDLIQPVAPGFLRIAGVGGSVRAGTDDPTCLPRWAREVLGAAWLQPVGTLAQQIPELRSAAWVNRAEIREELDTWVVELEFLWPAYGSHQLTWYAFHDDLADETWQLLMG
ncbi:hypothetical protein SAMN00790413_02284 [Deinococcus hopiensis KR-140]|uniref:Uncharacterized protein n=2 Tax=Deinococcus TaxID=1298 RepID=A0A1W1VMB8_9DEIO|nr:hypothetical protein SAMN00790413_02284 [Deinococcus hopiensis KR-140]